MGRIDLLNTERIENNQFVERKYKFILNDDELEKVLEILSQDINKHIYANYIYGYGGQNKSVYKELKINEHNNYKLIWFGYNGPKLKTLKGILIKILSFVFASTYGLIKINNSAITKNVMNSLSNLSMVGFFSFSKERSLDFENTFMENLNNPNYIPEEEIKKDQSFFSFIVDGGSEDKDGKGYLCQCAYGKNCAGELLKILEYTSRRW